MKHHIYAAIFGVSITTTVLADLSPDWKQTIPGSTNYIHTTTINRTKVKDGSTILAVWALYNMPEPELFRGQYVYSAKSLITIDCGAQTSRSRT